MIRVQRLKPGDRAFARTLFHVITTVFEGEQGELSDDYLDGLLSSDAFWALAAFDGEAIVGGLTAHTLPMTRAAVSELFIYDVAVQPAYQRRGIGRALIAALRTQAAQQGIGDVFVPADNEDIHALDFYQAIGGEGAPVTIFTFAPMS